MNRAEALAVVAVESEKEFQRLLKRRAEGELLYEPELSSLYIWELEVERTFAGTGYRDRAKYTRLFVTHKLAVQGACECILDYYGDGAWAQGYRDQIQMLMGSDRHLEVLETWLRTQNDLTFVIKPVEVRASAEPRKLVPAEP